MSHQITAQRLVRVDQAQREHDFQTLNVNPADEQGAILDYYRNRLLKINDHPKAVTPTVLKEKLFEIAAKYDSSVV